MNRLTNPSRNAIGDRAGPGGEALDLPVLDHLILGRGVYSFAERGELR